ncbi:MAG: SIS domain-containing protein [Thermoplasmata archaeon]|nr:SIS domain-containing protein [Candidatus Sysuiplasma acidicola]MBX8646315.1 SIS domain-containing protein [Candidatus Sysuiplasma acidicola]MDH2904791.1 SIS domain-containing protein [Methanomassiliicoccales archaeon]
MSAQIVKDIKTEIEEAISVHKLLLSIIDEIAAAGNLLAEAYKHGGKMVIFGNGGSAADAQHIAGELVGRFKKERKAIDATALSTNTSILTAIGNDYSFDEVFARQVEAICRPGDVVIGLSTSGRSRNVIEALKRAKIVGCRAVGLTGESGFPAGIAELCIKVPSKSTQRIQECHILIGHILSGIVEASLY